MIIKSDQGWTAFYPGSDGKKRPARDIPVPADLKESELGDWLADLCHEWATPSHSEVKRFES
ncbi:MAG: hypothetical protein AAF512_25725 [Pseudomonadota bacterium]